jgi:hypothetical protein
LFGFVGVNAQKRPVLNTPKYDRKPYHFGFTIGLNSMDFQIKNSPLVLSVNPNGSFVTDSIYSVECIKQAGFHLGIVSNLRLARYFDFRFLPAITFGQRNLEFLIRTPTGFTSKVMRIESTFIELPFLFKYKAKRLKNYRPYLLTGTTNRIDLASQKEIKESEKPKFRLEPIDWYLDFGFGIDYYFYFFKLSTEIKYSMGLKDVLKRDATQYSGMIERMSSNLLIVSFHFE